MRNKGNKNGKWARIGRRILASVLSAAILVATPGLPVISGGEITQKSGYVSEVEAAEADTSRIEITSVYETPNMKELVDRINEIRYEACKNGYPNPRKTSTALTLADYSPIGWNSNMEGIAMQRAAESLVYMAHTKPNGESTFTTVYNGTTASGENLAWNDSIREGLEAWYDEIDDYLMGDYSSKTGHYQQLITQEYKSFGLAGCKSDDVEISYKLGGYVSEASYEAPDNKLLNSYGEKTVSVEVKTQNIKGLRILSDKVILPVNEVHQLECVADITYVGVWQTSTVGRLLDEVTWTSSNTAVATVDSAGRVIGKKNGGVTITASISTAAGNMTASRNVVVSDGSLKIASILPLEPITVPEGRVPTLSDTVAAKLTDGQLLDVAVEWDMDGLGWRDFATLDGKTITVTGVAEGFTVEQVVIVPAAVVTAIYTVPEEITVDSGNRPATPMVRLSTESGVTWSSSATWDSAALTYAKKREGGTFTINGICHGYEASFTLIVNPATVESISYEKSISSMAGKAPVYPTTAEVVWSNGDVSEEEIVWNRTQQKRVDYASGNDGVYTVTGVVCGETISVTVNVISATVEKAYLANANITAESGSEPVYPETAFVDWSTGDTTRETITWSETDKAKVDYMAREGGSYTVSGIVYGTKITCNVTINPATAVSAFLTTPNKTIECGEAPTFPVTANVIWSNGDTTSENITWNRTEQLAVDYTNRVGGTYRVSGTVLGKKVYRTFTVNPAGVSSVKLEKTSMTVPSGMLPSYPQTATVTWSNGETSTETVTWSETDKGNVLYRNRDGGTYRVSGVVAGKTVTFTVIVSPAVANSATLSKTSISVAAGDTPSYPTTAALVWSNGDRTNETISWNASQQAAVDLKSGKAGSFKVSGTVQGKTVTITVNVTQRPVITKQPVNVTAVDGNGNVTFNAAANGVGLTYQWFWRKSSANDWAAYTAAGSENTSISIAAILARNGFQYYCEIKDSAGNKVNTATATLTVQNALTITKQPVNVTAVDGSGNAVFSIAATGKGLTYQWFWRKNSSNAWAAYTAAGSTNTSISIGAISARNGFQYYCVVKDSFGKKKDSNIVTLTVKDPDIVITKQPANVSVIDGSGNVTFSAAATGKGLTYQWFWRKNSSNAWAAYTGAASENTSISINAISARNGFQYYCLVRDAGGRSLSTNIATLTVKEPPVIIKSHPSSVSAEEGSGKVTFAVSVSGTNLTYQWFWRKNPNSAWLAYGAASASASSLEIEPILARNGFQYYCEIKDKTGYKVSSNIATLTVKESIISIVKQPVNVTAKDGSGDVYFSVIAAGTNLKYQWYWRKNSSSEWGVAGYTGAKTATLTVGAISARNGYQYYCKIINECGKVMDTNVATLTVNPALVITKQPVNITAADGSGEVKFTVGATGTGLIYQWYWRKNANSAWIAYGTGSAAYSTLPIGAISARNGFQYYCKITDSAGRTVSSNIVTLRVVASPTILTQPSNATVTSGGSDAVFTIEATGVGITYQWYWRKNANSDWTEYGTPGAAKNSLKIGAIPERNGFQYFCLVKDGVGRVASSNVVTLRVE